MTSPNVSFPSSLIEITWGTTQRDANGCLIRRNPNKYQEISDLLNNALQKISSSGTPIWQNIITRQMQNEKTRNFRIRLCYDNPNDEISRQFLILRFAIACEITFKMSSKDLLDEIDDCGIDTSNIRTKFKV